MVALDLNLACVTQKKKPATKAQLVADWKLLFGEKVSGHSPRRTGALRLIRRGWSIPQVAFLGRWKSSVIYQYAAEALESLPVNTGGAFANMGNTTSSVQTNTGVTGPTYEEVEEVKNYLLAELSLVKADQLKATQALDAEVEAMKERSKHNGDRLPPVVQAMASKIVHYNMDMANCSPPQAWKTLCGWHYHRSDFVFVTKVDGLNLCRKCWELAQSNRAKGGELQENLKTVAVLSSDVKSTTEASQSRFTRLESEVAKLSNSCEKSEPAVERIQTWMEKCDERLQRFSALSETLEIHRGDTQQSVMKLEATCKKANDHVESSISRLANFEYRLTAFDTRICSLEPLAELQPILAELTHKSSSVESRATSLEAHQKVLESNSETLLGEQRALAHQLAEQLLTLAELKKESTSSKEEIGQLRARTETVERESQQTTKAQEYLQNDVTEFQQALEQTQTRFKAELQSRIEESRMREEKQTRTIAVLQHSRQDLEHAMEGLKREMAQEPEKAAASGAAREAAQAADEAATAAAHAVEASKEALKEQAEQKDELVKKFDAWKLQAQEEAARRVLEAQDVAVGDLMKSMDRHRYQTKEDTLKTREELLQVIKSNNTLFEGKVAEVQQRLQLLAMEAGRSLGDLNGDLERLRRGDSMFQESTLDLSLPGLRDLRGAVHDEQKRRQNEQQRLTERFQEHCREAKGQPRIAQYQVEEPEKAASFTVLDGLKGCEAALTAMDRRVTNLEDCLEDKLYDLVRSDVNKHAAVQQGHLQEMEQKVDKLVHTLHTPSGHEHAAFAAPGPLGSRDAWREQFRSALNDSSYVKRALKTSRV
eukprot:s286_g5.t3